MPSFLSGNEISAKRIKNTQKTVYLLWLVKLEKQRFFFFGWKSWKRDYSFSTLAKFFEKLTFPTPLTGTRTCVCQGVRNVIFFGKFANAVNEWYQKICFLRRPGWKSISVVFISPVLLLCKLYFKCQMHLI